MLFSQLHTYFQIIFHYRLLQDWQFFFSLTFLLVFNIWLHFPTAATHSSLTGKWHMRHSTHCNSAVYWVGQPCQGCTPSQMLVSQEVFAWQPLWFSPISASVNCDYAVMIKIKAVPGYDHEGVYRHDQRRQWHPTLLPGKSHGRRSLEGCSPWGHWGSDTTERLHFHFSLSCIREGNGNPLQCSCLENPRDSGAWWAVVYGVAQSRTRLKWLSSSSSTDMTGLGIPFTQLHMQNALVERHKNEQASCIEIIGLTAPQLLPHWTLVCVSTSVTSRLFSLFLAT